MLAGCWNVREYWQSSSHVIREISCEIAPVSSSSMPTLILLLMVLSNRRHMQIVGVLE